MRDHTIHANFEYKQFNSLRDFYIFLIEYMYNDTILSMLGMVVVIH